MSGFAEFCIVTLAAATPVLVGAMCMMVQFKQWDREDAMREKRGKISYKRSDKPTFK